jgi:hypothetical protein
VMHCGGAAVGIGVHSDFVHKFQAIITSSDGRIFLQFFAQCD